MSEANYRAKAMQLKLDPIPRYYQLQQILRKRIESGEFKPDDQFPTENQLCQEYGVSRGTVGRAIKILVDEGWLHRIRGRGTFVSRPSLTPAFFHLTNFADDMQQRGLEPGTRLLSREVIPADEKIAAALQIPVKAPVIKISRLRLANGRPMAYETRYLAYDLCPQLMGEDLEQQSIHSLLIDKYGIPLIRACHTIEARVVSEQEAKILEVEPGSACFFIDRITYTTHERPGSWYQALYRGDEYRFIAEF
jgi:GntR family transcriptional regulator